MATLSMKTAAPVSSLTVVRSDDHERHHGLKPLQFFKLLRRVFIYTRPHRRARNWLVALVIIRSIQLPLLAWGIAAIINGPISRRDVRGTILATLGFAAFAIFTQVVFR